MLRQCPTECVPVSFASAPLLCAGVTDGDAGSGTSPGLCLSAAAAATMTAATGGGRL